MAKRKEDNLSLTAEQKRARAGPSPGPRSDSHSDSYSDSDSDMEGPSNEDVSFESSSESESGEFGIIESIQLENFMCHAMLGPVKFGSNVNFVVGYSGKSTLLTALIVGLGGKSLGSSLKEFVKEGEDSADISITLRNRGEKAFKSEVYGDSIIVHQHINGEGYPSYEIKDQAGNLVTSKKTELTAILNHFKIRVDNPVSILPQEMGRQLLRTGNESERYKFFLKATELEQIKQEYSDIMEKKAKSQHQIEQGEEQLEELKRQGIEIEEHFKTMVTLKQMLEDMKKEMTWAVVSETERQLDDMISNINVGDQCTIIFSQELEASKVIFDEAVNRYTALQDNVQKLTDEVSILKPRCLQAQEDAMRTFRAYSLARAFYNSSQNEYIRLEKIAEQHQNKLDIMKTTVEVGALEKQETLYMLKKKMRKFNRQEESLNEEIKQLQEDIENDEKELSQIGFDVAYVQDIMNDEIRQLERFKDCKSEPLKLFGAQMPALVDAIEDAHRQGHFTYKPLGPLGAYIRLRDPAYAMAIECCLKGLFLNFYCDNQKDSQILQNIIKKFYPLGPPKPQIIVSSFECELYDVKDRVPNHPEFPTVLTVLEIDDAVVANSLIDMMRIETVLLIKNNFVARKLVIPHGPPQNCTKVLTACGDEVLEGRYYSYDESRPYYLGNIETEIRELEKNIEKRSARLSGLKQRVCYLENSMEKKQETIDSHYQHLKEIKDNVTTLTSEINNYKDEEDSLSINLSVLEDEAQEIKEEMREVEERLKSRRETMEILKTPQMEAEQRHEELQLKCSLVSELMEHLIEEESQTVLEVESKHQSMLHYDNRLKEHLDSLRLKKKEMALKELELERETAEARCICPERKEVTKSASVLNREINALKERIETENYTHRKEEDVRKQYKEAKERYLDLDSKVKSLKELIKTLDEISTQRYESYQKGKRSLSLQCQVYFDSLIAQWSFCGQMLFDHVNETLSITVQPRDSPFSDFCDLNGGKQSFSNFILILTLWSVTKSPFRCLDAIDVYLDWERRKIAMDMILRIACSQQQHQYILLTPRYTCPPNPLIEIHQMPDLDNAEAAVVPTVVNPEDKEA